jgi:hypothetical protein
MRIKGKAAVIKGAGVEINATDVKSWKVGTLQMTSYQKSLSMQQ